MRYARYYSFVVGLFALFVTATQVKAETVEIYGPGGQSCGAWLQGVSERDKAAFHSWLLGFVAGAAIYGGDGDIAGHLDAYALIAWMDKYCEAHPLKAISDGAVLLVKELSKNKK